MTDERRTENPVCHEVRESIHERVDGTWDAADRESVERHLEACEDCRTLERELTEMRRAMRDLPEFPFPNDALQEVWEQTVDREPLGLRAWFPRLDWRLAAAAVATALVLLIVGGWFGYRFGVGSGVPREVAQVDEIDPEVLEALRDPEIRQQLKDALRVFELTSDALKRSQQAAVDDVLEGQVGRTLDRLPMDLPEASEPEKGRLGV